MLWAGKEAEVLAGCRLWGTEGLNGEEEVQRLGIVAFIFMMLHQMIPEENRRISRP